MLCNKDGSEHVAIVIWFCLIMFSGCVILYYAARPGIEMLRLKSTFRNSWMNLGWLISLTQTYLPRFLWRTWEEEVLFIPFYAPDGNIGYKSKLDLGMCLVKFGFCCKNKNIQQQSKPLLHDLFYSLYEKNVLLFRIWNKFKKGLG